MRRGAGRQFDFGRLGRLADASLGFEIAPDIHPRLQAKSLDEKRH